MMKLALTVLTLAICGSAMAAAPDYKLVDTIHIGGGAKWDYLYVDSDAHRLYVTHAIQTEVIDTQTDKLIGTIGDTQGVHGVAIAKEFGKGFITDGTANAVAVFDLSTLKNTGSIKVGTKPDSIVYAPASQKVVAFNGKSNSASIIDAKTLKVVATVAVPGKPEFSVVGADGNVYFNLEDIGQIGSINLTTNKFVKAHSLKPCDGPSGLTIDEKQNLYSVCANNLMMVTSTAGKNIGQAKIGSDPDGVAYMDGYAFSANGADGNMTVVGLVDGKFQTVATIPTQFGARTIAADPAAHRLYLPTADFKPATGDEKRQRIADTFRVLVLEKQ
ncbi:YncE family protein [Glaciimonas soli]|uniref:YncE family protein n=1 Tax=Glaciimonas soli TaxID=2590999 RepID=A0A843YSD4_9BURK|nr:YncE family protein [Glaciimonas soli]MQR02639.1 YncE family protein [Glaciimonas soli]